jgi:hypothetical protein
VVHLWAFRARVCVTEMYFFGVINLELFLLVLQEVLLLFRLSNLSVMM